MDGFSSPLRGLCVIQRHNGIDPDDDHNVASGAPGNDNLLITDGMKHLVCVHDFGRASQSDNDNDFDVEQYLDRT